MGCGLGCGLGLPSLDWGCRSMPSSTKKMVSWTKGEGRSVARDVEALATRREWSRALGRGVGDEENWVLEIMTHSISAYGEIST